MIIIVNGNLIFQKTGYFAYVTSSNHECVIIRSKNDKLKPNIVFSYTDAKKGVDLSDQMSLYCNCLRKTVKWYRKIVIELLCGICLVNAWYIHKKCGTKCFQILQFRERIIDYLLMNIGNLSNEVIMSKRKHFLTSYEGSARKTRKQRMLQTLSRDKLALSLACFKKLHRKNR
ncbi:uncharacterized protein LOC143431878 [Xylocopa sonorina]|uniref:uncharacterized protein LOC143431878 n=1 Tax=Xylocopa sonorina TaxID=1818115 RepID=UPI00403AC7E9